MAIRETAPHLEHALYRFFDAQGELLYVGITLDPSARWKGHARNKHWWCDVATIDIERVVGRAAALEAEAEAILEEMPRYNVQGAYR